MMLDSAAKKHVLEYLEGIVCLSPAVDAEPYFSWSPCECCGSCLGGDRYDLTGRLDSVTGDFIEVSCCVDCYSFLFMDDAE